MDNVDINGSVAEQTMEKWSPVLEGIDSDYTRRVTAQLLENQAKAILNDCQQYRWCAAHAGTSFADFLPW